MKSSLLDVGLVLAHGVGGREDLPIPFSYAMTGAVVALLVSFAALGMLWPSPRFDGGRAGRPLPSGLTRVLDASATRWSLRVIGLALTCLVVATSVAGPDTAANPTATMIYVVFWVGLVPASLLAGPVWEALNPLRTLHLLLARLMRTSPETGLLRLPEWLGYWPAAVALLAFGWLELAAPNRTTLPVLRTFLLLYAGVMLLGGALFGARWFGRADGFEVFSTLVGRLSVFGRRADGRLVVRNPLQGLDTVPALPGVVAVVAVLLGTTAFDGLSNSPWWVELTQAGTLGGPTLAATVGLVGTVAVFGLAYVLATVAAGSVGEMGRRTAPAEFAHSIVPIVVGYFAAHYFSLFVFEGQRAVILLSDPFVTGANWLGTAGRAIDYTVVSPAAIAMVQVLAVVVGHVLGVVSAHDRAVRLFPRAQALAGQVPLLGLMVCYTLAGLLLLFAG